MPQLYQPAFILSLSTFLEKLRDTNVISFKETNKLPYFKIPTSFIVYDLKILKNKMFLSTGIAYDLLTPEQGRGKLWPRRHMNATK